MRKERIVVDIKDLNKIIQIDNYSMSLQTNITSVVANCDYISVFDATVFFLSMKRSHRRQTQINRRFSQRTEAVQRRRDEFQRIIDLCSKTDRCHIRRSQRIQQSVHKRK